MTDDETFASQAMTRFGEAWALQSAIHALGLTQAPVGMTDTQLAQRRSMITVMQGLLRKQRDKLVVLGIYEWQRAKPTTETPSTLSPQPNDTPSTTNESSLPIPESQR